LKQRAVSIRILVMKNSNYTFKTIIIGLACLAFLPIARAVVPAPDGGYPGGNTAEGQAALLSLTTGGFNTANGFLSLRSDTVGGFNTAIGAGTLLANTADSNTATGAGALLSNTTAAGNTAMGAFALFSNTTGGTLENIQGIDLGPNVAVGHEALESNTVASANTAVGYQALHGLTSGPLGFEHFGLCTAVGFQALANANGNGVANNAFGYQALKNNTDGGGNTAIGLSALFDNTTGNGNVAVGNNAVLHNVGGGHNTAIGESSLTNNTNGSENTAIGFIALGSATGNGNTAVGVGAGATVTGDDNTIIGQNAGGSIGAGNNVIAIGTAGAPLDNSCYIGNIFGQAGGAQAVFVSAEGKLGAQVSSRRFKHDIKPIDQASEVLFSLKPVSFRYKNEIDPVGRAQFGLVAEDVEKVSPDLVIRDKDGKPYTVRYDQVNAMLLNEFLKEHRKVGKLEATVEQQQKSFESRFAEQEREIRALTSDIHKINAQFAAMDPPRGLTISEPALQVALANQ